MAVLALFTALTAFSAYNTTSRASAIAMYDGEGGVMDQDVIDYLMSFGYTDVVIIETSPNGDRRCTANDLMGNPYTIRVFVKGGQIVGHEEQGNN